MEDYVLICPRDVRVGQKLAQRLSPLCVRGGTAGLAPHPLPKFVGEKAREDNLHASTLAHAPMLSFPFLFL
jgi:hypothetical protein